MKALASVKIARRPIDGDDLSAPAMLRGMAESLPPCRAQNSLLFFTEDVLFPVNGIIIFFRCDANRDVTLFMLETTGLRDLCALAVVVLLHKRTYLEKKNELLESDIYAPIAEDLTDGVRKTLISLLQYFEHETCDTELPKIRNYIHYVCTLTYTKPTIEAFGA
ncbi:hypothetical protein M514_05141 [Trichuris suis]|uniref:Uncharacterized protein n=1 Tax=Trichuris suis TaxID=68888 RepID=A0A085MTQ3_9BILA|nr:hypothetical protein M514_05141 [Trichuris suis]